MNKIIEFCRNKCINLEEHNGIHSYAMSRENIINYIDLLEKENISLYGIDIVYIENGIYNYLIFPNEYVSWCADNVSMEKKYDFFKEKISTFNSKRSVAFVPIDDVVSIVWATINLEPNLPIPI